MRGDEERVIAAFCAWFRDSGWRLTREVEFANAGAERGAERLYVEAKGRTATVGLDVDTMYGQILRRLPTSEDARRVSEWIRECEVAWFVCENALDAVALETALKSERKPLLTRI